MAHPTPERYWLVLPNGGRQRIDPAQFDLGLLAEQARKIGGRLVVERPATVDAAPRTIAFEPPLSALGPLFRSRLERIYRCAEDFTIDMNSRPTTRVLGGYYRKRRLVRVYTHDRVTGRRPTEELFDTFLHEVAHHLEYTEHHSFKARSCGRVHGRMHSALFWRILGELKRRWAELQRAGEA
jgi:hypothetical protein